MAIVTDLHILGTKSEAVDLSAIPRDVIQEMRDNLKKGHGLAAIQIGYSLRIILTKAQSRVIINPLVMARSGSVEMMETCLSRPNVRVKKTRPLSMKIAAYDEDGIPFIWEAKYHAARVLAHEIDHLNGIYI